MQVNGDTLIYTDSSDSNAVTRVADVAKPIVGSWYFGSTSTPDNLAVFTFFSDGTYTLADDGDTAVDSNGQDGMERGTYTWNSTTGAFTSTTTVNTDGGWGISSPGCDNMQVSGSTLNVTCTDSEGTYTVSLTRYSLSRSRKSVPSPWRKPG